MVYSDTPGCIGRHDRYLDASPGYFNGLIDDFRYWDRALTEDDITQLCSALSVEESDYEKDAITIYPNPAFEKIYLDTNLNEIKSIAMYNSVGQEIYAGTFTNSIDVSNFPAGVYFLSIKNGDKIINKKVVIR